jgi:hypothetical protein
MTIRVKPLARQPMGLSEIYRHSKQLEDSAVNQRLHTESV